MSEWNEWQRGIYERALHWNQRVPETGVLYLSELSGPDGAHYTLFFEPGATPEFKARTKAISRNNWDVTGFTCITIQP